MILWDILLQGIYDLLGLNFLLSLKSDLILITAMSGDIQGISTLHRIKRLGWIVITLASSMLRWMGIGSISIIHRRTSHMQGMVQI